MTLGKILAREREKLGEPDPTRFTDAILTDYTNDAQKQIAMELDWPQATQTLSLATATYTWNGFPLFQIQPIIKLLRAYVISPNGSQQPLVMTNIPTLQGDIIEVYDQSSGTLIGFPQFTPEWKVDQAQSYPVQSPPRGIVPSSAPYQFVAEGVQRPSIFFVGGFAGIVPPAISSGDFTAGLDYIPSPPNLVKSNDLSIYPELFLDAISYKAITYAKFSDRDGQLGSASALYREQVRDVLRPWVDNFLANMPKRMTPITKRSYFKGQYDV